MIGSHMQMIDIIVRNRSRKKTESKTQTQMNLKYSKPELNQNPKYLNVYYIFISKIIKAKPNRESNEYPNTLKKN